MAKHGTVPSPFQARWHTNIRLHDPQQLIQIDTPFMDMAVAAAGVMRRPSAIVPAASLQQQHQQLQQQQQETSGSGNGGRSSGASSADDPKWEAEFLQLFWEEEKRRAQHKGSSKVRKKRVRTPEQKAIEA